MMIRTLTRARWVLDDLHVTTTGNTVVSECYMTLYYHAHFGFLACDVKEV